MGSAKAKKYTLYLPFLLALILFLFLYRYFFPQGDDFSFSIHGENISHIWDYYIYYYTYAGSRMSNLFASLLLLKGLSIWKILTPVVIQGSAFLLFYCVTGRITAQDGRWKRDFTLACVCAFFPGLIAISHRLFADTFLWMDGSCNYLYPMFFFLLGFLPFWNALRNRPLPRVLKWVCPIFFVLSGLLHEQIANLLFIFCLVTLILLHKNGKFPKYLWTLTALSLACIIFTYTCPGAYYRLGKTKSHSIHPIRLLFNNFCIYFSQFNRSLWPVAFLLGACAIYLLYRCSGKLFSFLTVFIGAGSLMALCSNGLPFLRFNVTTPHQGFRLLLLLLMWILYYIAILVAFLIFFRQKAKGGFVVALYFGMWASQAIPVALGCIGRSFLPLAILTLLLVLCLMDSSNLKAAFYVQLPVAVVAVGSLLYLFSPVAANYASYCEMQTQIEKAAAVQTGTVTFDQGKFNSDYCYYNAFSSAYRYELHHYYHLSKYVTFSFKR